ncbi:hypothetical protein SASPL_153372 [Salvia splendens]|uniref:Disease resistance protein RPM1 n=1 Tax=Salvia splendens TaxID=180675 RepID=A0A8X8W528_SALSN|nr:probable disease resistance protein RF9 isoform X2 [Salvia splendens]KAG6388173.1 hypothetical protein SASPL_153372 [Salvia splendens]
MAAEAAISTAVEVLGSLLIQKVKSLRSVEGKVRSLKEELEWMQSFLKDANRKQAEDEGVRNWIRKIREVAQDAEDTIEMFLINVENANSRGSSLLKSCSSFPKRMYYLDRIGDEIDSIRARLDAIDKSRERFGIREASEPVLSLDIESRRRLAPTQNDEQVVGIEGDVREVVRELLLDEGKGGVWVGVIEGMGGIGKSTLAREVYNHRDVAGGGGFECRGWVVVSSEFTPRETMKQLILELPGSDRRKVREVEESSKDELYIQRKLQEMLREQLQGKNYLIVLDDVWEKEHWEYLKSSFPNQKDKRSRLLLTTRNKVIGKYCQYVHKMKALDLEKSWELLLERAFIGSKNEECMKELECIGAQILEKCHGLPLAISVVGGLLMQTQTKNGWEQVYNQLNSYLGTYESNVSAILELSYQNLSPQLKSCFLCLAFFKEDSTIRAKRLLNVWVGQGLIQQTGSGTVDEIARGYLNELINRNMVQVEDVIIGDRVRNCRLHDLIREVCLRKAKEEIGLEIVKGQDVISCLYKPRHRVVYGKNLDTSSPSHNKYLRSLFILNVDSDGNAYMTTPSHYWKSFKLLKMLDLDGFAFQKLPRSVQLLTGLKCLRIRKSHNIFRDVLELPTWLESLKKLEILCVENQYVKFPKDALRLEKLRHFHVHSVYGRAMKVENWKSIESLKLIRLEDWLECSSGLTGRCHVRKLGIHMIETERQNELQRSLEKMVNLVELHLEFNPTSLMSPKIIPRLNGLTKLKLDGGMLECSSASEFPPNLSRLTLEYVRLVEDPMPELGKLPKLQYLKLYRRRISNEEWRMRVLREGFPCLEALSLENLNRLRGIDVEEGGMPRLRQLRIRKCPNLEIENLPEHIKCAVATA